MILNIALIQNSLIWEDVVSNLSQFSLILDHLKPEIDLIVLPEMFTSGFTMNPEKVATQMNGEVVQWMQMQAEQHQEIVSFLTK
jgi:predicted amidohydrolase